MFYKGLDSDNRIMAPVIGRASLPEIQAGDKIGGVSMGGKLAEPPKKCVSVDRHWRRLNNPARRMVLHQPHQIHQTTPVMMLSASNTIIYR